MRTSKILAIPVAILVALLFTQCEHEKGGCTDPDAINYDVTADYSDGSCIYDVNNIDLIYCNEAVTGNLVINNNTSNELYLYKNSEWVTCIPPNDTSFLVRIENPQAEVFELQIYKADDVSNSNEPPTELVFRQWRVALSENMNEQERANWLINGSDQFSGTGTIMFDYPEIDEYGQEVIYQVDVYLNSETGTRLVSMQPGFSNKKVNVNYGVHILYFKYWYSDPDSPSDNYTVLGWGEAKDIVLNAEHTESSIDIPSFASNKGKFGYVKIENNYSSPINIFANGVLIESIAKISDATQALSVIPSNNYTEFLIPIENDYTITAKSLDGSKTYASYTSVDVLQDETAVLKFGTVLTSVIIENNSSTNLGLFSIDEEYLGQSIPSNSSSGKFYIPGNIDTLLLMDFQRTVKIGKKVESTIVIDTLGDYHVNQLTITDAWDYYEGSYTSDTTIEHNESSSMTADLTLTGTATLYFEYNVSSEPNFDKFSFSIDGSAEINDISGNTGWIVFSKTLQPGDYELVWEYTKDFDVSQGLDQVSIRNLRIEE